MQSLRLLSVNGPQERSKVSVTCYFRESEMEHLDRYEKKTTISIRFRDRFVLCENRKILYCKRGFFVWVLLYLNSNC